MTSIDTSKFTFADAGGVVSRESQLHWRQIVDLERELDGLVAHLDARNCGTLVSAANNGLPIVLTWDTHLGEDRVERGTVTVVVTRLVPPSPVHPTNSGYVRVRYSGSEHDVWLSQVRRARRPEVETTYLSVEEASKPLAG